MICQRKLVVEKWIGERVKFMEMSPTRNSQRNLGVNCQSIRLALCPCERKEQGRPQSCIKESSQEPDCRDRGFSGKILILGVDGPGFKLQPCPVSKIMTWARALTSPSDHLSALEGMNLTQQRCGEEQGDNIYKYLPQSQYSIKAVCSIISIGNYRG